MKKSTKVALTLLVPAMTAYGCGNQSKTVQAPANTPTSQLQATMTIPVTCSCGHSFTASRDKAGKTVQCPKCEQSLTVLAGGTQATTYTSGYRSNSYYPRSTYSPWFGGYRSHTDSHVSSPPPASPLHPIVSPLHMNSTQSHSTTPQSHTTLASHAPSVSHGSTSGFGGTGAHFSGGS